MSENNTNSREPMLEMFIFETLQLVEQLEDILIESEKSNHISSSSINEVFRFMHTIKGAAAMMMYDNVAKLTHAAEDLFSSIRAAHDPVIDCVRLTDIVLRVSDFIKNEVAKIDNGKDPDGNPEVLIGQVRQYLADFNQQQGLDVQPVPAAPVSATKPPETVKATPAAQAVKTAEKSQAIDLDDDINLKKYDALIFFEDGCQMENMRAFTVVHSLMSHVHEMIFEPADIADNEQSSEIIRENGFHIRFTSEESQEMLYACLDQTLFLERLEFEEVDDLNIEPTEPATLPEHDQPQKTGDSTKSAEIKISLEDEPKSAEPVPVTATPDNIVQSTGKAQSIISVNITKLDQLMDLVGELVIAEAMVTRNPELDGIVLENFHKSARQLNKLTTELQDIAMSIRMIPIAATFHKMQRIIRDMNRKLGKEVELTVVGEETEVDKSIIDNLSDPLMHLIRNALDHGIESPEERLAAGKPEKGNVLLEARNSGADVWITIKDDGRGLNKNKILKKAAQQGLLTKPEADYSEKEIFEFILLPGFSTKDAVSEFSGRGVGMDVVRENIRKINGAITLDSVQGKGTTIQIRIPLTLAIINGMLINVGSTSFIIPTTTIRETFRATAKQIVRDTDSAEMMMIRGQCYSVSRLHKQFKIEPIITDLTQGIIVVVEDGDKTLCIFADQLVGEQQVVVKPLPNYIKNTIGLAGCTILGNGSISLIIDVNDLIKIH